MISRIFSAPKGRGRILALFVQLKLYDIQKGIRIFKIAIVKNIKMSLAENLKRFLKDKEKGDKTTAAPEGVCPNCWGRQEWGGEFYKQIKARNITPESHTYTSFINEVASKLDEIKLKEDTYECTTCHVKYKHDH